MALHVKTSLEGTEDVSAATLLCGGRPGVFLRSEVFASPAAAGSLPRSGLARLPLDLFLGADVSMLCTWHH